MSELKKVLIISVFLICLSFAGIYLALNNFEFNFHTSKLIINGNSIEETLYFTPNKPYRTLYRDFQSAINGKTNENIIIERVLCSSGTAYYRDVVGRCYTTPDFEREVKCLDATENNEYGCSFGNVYGFNKGEDYWVKASYIVNPPVIYNINSKQYIKFEAYSENRHNKLVIGENFFIEGNFVSKKSYSPYEDVIIYIPYETGRDKIDSYPEIRQSSFKYDSSNYKIILFVFLIILPAFLFFGIWFFFGRETSFIDVPKELSNYPIKRKGWEVAAFFNPPFPGFGKEIFSSLMIELYHKEAFDIHIENKNVMIKLNDFKKIKNLDVIETKFLDFLAELKKRSNEPNPEEYFNFDKEAKSFGNRIFIREKAKEIDKIIKKTKKEYQKNIYAGSIISIASIVFIVQIAVFGILPESFIKYLFFVYFIFFITVFFTSVLSALLISFKKEYYKEYQQWQAFKNYLYHKPSIKYHGHKGVVLWEEYLIYGTAFGFSKKVISELKKLNLIDDRHYSVYRGIGVSASSSFASVSGTGGAGSGGAGGGGGGGR
jgi:hypothetical protein